MNLTTLKDSAAAAARRSYTAKEVAVAVLTLGILAPLAVLLATAPAPAEAADPVRDQSLRLLEEALPVARSIEIPTDFKRATADQRDKYTMAVMDAMHPFDETDAEGRVYSVLPFTDDFGDVVFCVLVEEGQEVRTYGIDSFCN